jgi:hypothetical protein
VKPERASDPYNLGVSPHRRPGSAGSDAPGSGAAPGRFGDSGDPGDPGDPAASGDLSSAGYPQDQLPSGDMSLEPQELPPPPDWAPPETFDGPRIEPLEPSPFEPEPVALEERQAATEALAARILARLNPEQQDRKSVV